MQRLSIHYTTAKVRILINNRRDMKHPKGYEKEYEHTTTNFHHAIICHIIMFVDLSVIGDQVHEYSEFL